MQYIEIFIALNMTNIQIKHCDILLSYFSSKHRLLVLIKTVSVCHLFWFTSGRLFEFMDVVSLSFVKIINVNITNTLLFLL